MRLDQLSLKYESNGDPGAESNNAGDAGGESYGLYQFADNAGIPRQFINWLKAQGSPYAYLADLSTGTPDFDAAWKEIAAKDPDGFSEAQYEFAKTLYYEPAVARAKLAFINMEKHSEALGAVLWSAAVQYDSYYCTELFADSATLLGYADASSLDDISFDEQLIKAIYQVRASDDWTTGSPDLRPGLRNRFINECQDALALLAQK